MSKVYRVLALFAVLAMLVAGCVAPTTAPAPAAEAPAAEVPATEQPAAEEPAAAAGGAEYHGAFPYPVSYTHLRAHETVLDLVCRLLL